MRNVWSHMACAAAVSWVVGLAAATADDAILRLPPTDFGPEAVDQTRFIRGQDETSLSGAADAFSRACGRETCATDCVGRWCDNIEVWSVGDGFRNIGDVVPGPGGGVPVQANFGLRTVVNSAFAIGESKIRGQIGGSFGAYNLQGRDTAFGAADAGAQAQEFLTVGLYKRSFVSQGDRLAWGLVYDQFWANDWGTFGQNPRVGQLRGLVSYALNNHNALGVTGAGCVMRDNEILVFSGHGFPHFDVRSMNYVNAFWTHNYAMGGETTLFVGGVDHSQWSDWMFGFNGRAPLNDRTALYGGLTYVVPNRPAGPAGNAQETWNVSAGIVFYFGGKAVARDISGQQGLALMNVADNGSLLISK